MKKAILIAVIVLAIILAVVKDVLVYLGLSILMALAVWLVGKVWGYGTKKAITTILSLAVILPIILIALVGMIKMQSNPSGTNEIVAATIDQIVNFFADKIVYIVLADIAGIIAGAIINIFRGN